VVTSPDDRQGFAGGTRAMIPFRACDSGTIIRERSLSTIRHLCISLSRRYLQSTRSHSLVKDAFRVLALIRLVVRSLVSPLLSRLALVLASLARW